MCNGLLVLAVLHGVYKKATTHFIAIAHSHSIPDEFLAQPTFCAEGFALSLTLGAHARGLMKFVCVSVCLSVTALAASASAYT